MPTIKPKCQSVLPWLRANLGPHALAPLTGQDARALSVAVQAIALYAACDYSAEVRSLQAFACAVNCMQESTRHLAYHSIAHILDWSDRARLWERAGLQAINVGRCAYE